MIHFRKNRLTSMDEPLVTVVIPAYGRAVLIQEAIASCPKTVDGMPIEVMVVDDGSPDSLEAVVSPMGVVFHRLSQNAGSSVARNAGLALATGRYVKFLDSDDVLRPEALAEEVAIANQTGADIVVSGWRNVTLVSDDSSNVNRVHAAPVFNSIPDDLLAGLAVPTGAALYRRTCLHDVSWDPRLSKLNDWDYFVRAALVSKSIATCPAISYDWRAHDGEQITSSSTFLKNADEFYVILNKLIDSLVANDMLTASRKRRAAQYLYKELRGLYRFDRLRGRAQLQRIHALDPVFKPLDEEHSALFRSLGQVGLLSSALETYGWLRNVIDRFQARAR